VRRIKHLGFAVLAAMALTALLGAGTASASQFRAEEYPTSVTATQSGQHIFKLTGKNLICDSVTMSGTFAKASNTANLTPVFKTCKLAGTAATVTTKSCTFVLSSNEAPTSDGLAIACSAGDLIEAKTALCRVTIPAQAGLGAVSVDNTFGKKSRNRTITTTLSITGLEYTEIGLACGSPGTYKTGSYSGTSVTKGFNAAAEHWVGVYVGKEQTDIPPYFEAASFPQTVTAQENYSYVYLPNWGTSFPCTTMIGISTWTSFANQVDQPISAWEGCSSIGKISMNSCKFTLRGVTSEPYPFSEPKSIVADGTLGISCTNAGDAITFKVLSGCLNRIPPQSGLAGVHFVNTEIEGNRSISATVKTKMKFVAENGCPSAGTYENGAFSFEWVLKSSGQGVWIE
jgi:hypothetical protein